jgi:deoxyadenosine/deoxycytidine kinase
MIIEFIGCTGAGKTTLISKVQRKLAETSDVTTSYELVAAPLGLRGVSHRTVRNFIQEITVLPIFIRTLNRNKEPIVFTLRMLERQADFSIFTLNNLRSVERKIGVHEMIRRRENDRIVLVDEGTLLLAHKVFVFSSADYTPDEIATFASLIPLPDIIVYVKAPFDSLVKRTLQRTDPPRELRSKNQAMVEKYVSRAVTMFDRLVKADSIQSRLLIVENLDTNANGNNNTVDNITQFVQNYGPSIKTV